MAGDERYGETASRIMGRIGKGEATATSTLVLAQVFAYLKRKGRADVIPQFLDFVKSCPALKKAETSFVDITAAQRLTEAKDLKWALWDDLVIAAQMRRMKLLEIYSNDQDFDAIPGVQRVFE